MTDPQQPTISATCDQAEDGSYTASVRVSGIASEEQAKAELQRMRGALSEYRRASVDFLPHDDILRFACRVLAGEAPTASDKDEARRGLTLLRRSIRPAASAPSREVPAEEYGSVEMPYQIHPQPRPEELRLLSWIMRSFGNDHPAYGDVVALAAPSTPVAAEETKNA